jgi:hypothetical protein
MKKIIVCLFTIISIGVYSKPVYITLCGIDEKQIFGCLTQDKKTISLCAGKDDSYIIFRYGTKDNIETEFPGIKQDSWSRFRYSFYLRGGGAENEGIDVNYLKFSHRGSDYTIFEEFYSAGNKKECGLVIKDRSTGKEIKIYAVPATNTGSLAALRDYDKIQMEE